MRLVTAYLPEDLIALIDRALEKQREARKGVRLTRADFIREVLYRACGDELTPSEPVSEPAA